MTNNQGVELIKAIDVPSFEVYSRSHCLFRFLSAGYCDNSLINAPIYLDLGAALAAFGLIFAVYQLRRPKWDIVLQLRAWWQRNLFWIFGGMALILILTRVLITQIPSLYLSYPFNVPIFYEILGYIFFILSPLSLIYFANKTTSLFNSQNGRKFYEIMVSEIAQGNEERLNAALEVLFANFNEICRFASTAKDDQEARDSARAILDVIFSDASVVKLLTTKRIVALQYVFNTIEKHRVNRQQSGIGIPKLMQGLFYDEESFLYKQLDRSGLALSSNIYESIFSSPILLTNFDIFDYPTIDYFGRERIATIGLKVFIKSLSESIETYLKTGKVPANHINSGIEYLSEIFGDLCLKISTEERRGVDTKYSLKNDWWSIHLIANFFGHDYIFLAYEEELNQEVVSREKLASEVNFHSYQTINEGIAAAIYKAIEQLSYIHKTEDIYHNVHGLLRGMVYDGNLKEGYRKPFEKRMWEQIGKNIVQRHYPATLRAYLTAIGFCVASDTTREGWIGEQSERMRRLLYIDLKPLFDRNEEMVDQKLMKDVLLPESMDYENGNFTYTFSFGKGRKVTILPPPEGSISALVGIDLNNNSIV